LNNLKKFSSLIYVNQNVEMWYRWQEEATQTHSSASSAFAIATREAAKKLF